MRPAIPENGDSNEYLWHIPPSAEKLDQLLSSLSDIDEILEVEPRDQNSLVRKFRILINLGRYWDALNVSEKLIEQNSGDPGPYVFRSIAYFALGHPQEAVLSAQDSVNLSTHGAELIEVLKAVYLAEAYDDYDLTECLAALEKATDSLEDGNTPVIMIMLKLQQARILSVLNRYHEALDVLDDIQGPGDLGSIELQIVPEMTLQRTYDVLKLGCLKEIGAYESALGHWESVCQRDPENYMDLIFLAEIYSWMGSYEASFEILDKAIELEPDQFTAYETKAIILEEYGDIRQALELLECLLDRDSISVEIISACARHAVNLAKYEKALEYTNTALSRDPNCTSALLTEACVFIMQGNQVEAAKILGELIGADESGSAAYNSQLAYMLMAEAPSKAIEYLDSIENPGTFLAPFIDAIRGSALAQLCKFKDALLYLNKAWRESLSAPHAAQFLNLYIDLLDKLEMDQEIICVLSEMIEGKTAIFSEEPFHLFFKLGETLARQERYDEAIAALESSKSYATAFSADLEIIRCHLQREDTSTVLELAGAVLEKIARDYNEGDFDLAGARGNIYEIYTMQGLAFLETDNVEGAQEAFKKALDGQPNSPYIHWVVGSLCQSSGDLIKALEHFRMATFLDPNDQQYKRSYEEASELIQDELYHRYETNIDATYEELSEGAVVKKEVWDSLVSESKKAFSTAEFLYHTYNTLERFDLSAVVIGYCRVVEIEIRNKITAPLLSLYDDNPERYNGEKLISIGDEGYISYEGLRQGIEIGRVQYLLQHYQQQENPILGDFFESKDNEAVEWTLQDLPIILKKIRNIRNKAAHQGTIKISHLEHIRSKIVDEEDGVLSGLTSL